MQGRAGIFVYGCRSVDVECDSQDLQAGNVRMGVNMSLEVEFAGVSFKNPVTTASGTFGSGMEYSEFVALDKLGAVTTKGVASVPWHAIFLFSLNIMRESLSMCAGARRRIMSR